MKYFHFTFTLVFVLLLNACSAQKQGVLSNDFQAKENRYLDQNLPGLTPRLFATDIVSTEDHHETVVTFSPDMKELSFRRNGGEYKEPTLLFMQYKNGKWRRKYIADSDANKYEERFNPSVSDIKNLDAFKDIPIVGYDISARGTCYFYV